MNEEILSTVLRYKKLSEDTVNHDTMMKNDTMVQFLAYCLCSEDSIVIETTLETFGNLIANKTNRVKLNSMFGVCESLKSTSERKDIMPNLKERAAALYIDLERNSASTVTSSAPCDVTNSVDRRKLATKVIILQVQGLYPETRQELESVVIKIRGVVSIILDVEMQRCVIRTLKTVTPLMIAEEIAKKTSMVPRQVLRNKYNQEFLQNLLKDDKDEDEDTLPPYVEEEYEPVKDNAVLSFQTLKTNASSWLNAASSFIQNSLYW